MKVLIKLNNDNPEFIRKIVDQFGKYDKKSDRDKVYGWTNGSKELMQYLLDSIDNLNILEIIK